MPTPVFLKERLKSAAGAKDRFGATAAEVLETAALIAAADQNWDKATIAAFQKDQEIHQKVWGKLVAIHKDQRLKPLQTQLPASYTALYALVVMSDQEFTAAVSEGLLSRTNSNTPLSSRAILEWTKAYRLRASGIEQEVPLTLVLKQDLVDQQHQDLMAALKRVAEQYGAEVRVGKRGLRQAEIKAESRRVLAAELEEQLMREIACVVADAPDDLKSKFKIATASDLVAAPRATFTGFFQCLVCKVDIEFWRQYGHAYALKIARDYNLTESRAERFQLRERLNTAVNRWGVKLEGFESSATHLLKTYMGVEANQLGMGGSDASS